MKKSLKSLFLAALFLPSLLFAGATERPTKVLYLSGMGKDDPVMWDFYCTAGANSGSWSRIGVPSCWEMQGFGAYNYGHDRPAHDEEGIYRRSFRVPASWKGLRTFIVFEGVMTDAEVLVNGQTAGPIHQGAFYRFKYDITSLLDMDGDNALEVRVRKESLNPSINEAERRADYWIFGGIFRPVYLEGVPSSFIERVAVDALSDGSFRADVILDSGPVSPEGMRAAVRVLDSKGKEVAQSTSFPFTGDSTRVFLKVNSPHPWTSETPSLYTAEFSLNGKDGSLLHTVRRKFGFRTIEFRERDGFYVNGVKVKFKGVCRHTFWPESGRTSSPALALEDVRLIKEMNMNAVRMSHYPPDSYFLDICDSLGLYVIDELAGWQSAYDGPTACRLARDMVRRDVNHPSVVIWSNGNEGGFPVQARSVYGANDIQGRHVVEPWSRFNGTDTNHYPKYANAASRARKGDVVYMPTESLHGLHDGGHGAGLKDYWDMIRTTPCAAGQFLWDFADEGVVRHDIRDSIDVFNDKAPDGILGPHHEKEGSFFAIKEIWSPVSVQDPDMATFDGTLTISNRYHFTDLSSCSFKSSLISYGNPFEQASVRTSPVQVLPVSLPPWTEGGRAQLVLPEGWRDADILSFSAFGPTGEELYTWTWPISDPGSIAGRLIPQGSPRKAKVVQDNDILTVKTGDLAISFNKHTGILTDLRKGGKVVPFPDGPRFSGVSEEVRSVCCGKGAEGCYIEVTFSPDAFIRWTVLGDGWLTLKYRYILDGDFDCAGLTFKYPEEGISRAQLFADGPYRVWKNRTAGVSYGLHDKKYNDTITGQSWDYPEFKGYYSRFTALRLEGKDHTLTIVGGNEGDYLHLFTPGKPKYMSQNADPQFPAGDISILRSISAIGTKFTTAPEEGPMGARAHFENTPVEGELYFHID